MSDWPGLELVVVAAVLAEHHEVGLLVPPGQLVLHVPVVLTGQGVVVPAVGVQQRPHMQNVTYCNCASDTTQPIIFSHAFFIKIF